MTIMCTLCEAQADIVTEDQEVAIGQRSAVVPQARVVCRSCGEVYVTPDQYEENRLAAVRAMRQSEGLMLPEDIVRLRERLGLTQEGLEELLGVGAKTVVRWENGSVFQSSATNTLLRLLEDDPLVVGVLRALKGAVTMHTMEKVFIRAADRYETGGKQTTPISDREIEPRSWATKTSYRAPDVSHQAEFFDDIQEERYAVA